MPSAADLRRAFGLEQGQELGAKREWQISASHVGHVVKEQNERYEFPTEVTLEWRRRGKPAASAGKQLEERRRKAEAAFWEATREKRVVYSAYGSPYECSYGPPSAVALDEEGAAWKLTCLGTVVRRRDVPTLKEQKAQEREEQGVREVSAEEQKSYLTGYRVIKSRFGSSRCATCGDTIEPGVKICKEKGDSTKGGWSHALCVVQHLQEQAGEGGAEGEEPGADEQQQQEEEEEETGEAPVHRGKRKKAAPTGPATGGKRRRKGEAGAGAGGSKRGGKTKPGGQKAAAQAGGSGGGRGRKRQMHRSASEE